ncbi:MAG TPA: uroporphyrinogen-III synthase [Puia sp.]|nr:uroporphyrinogen-III synthase [Puia sp.]
MSRTTRYLLATGALPPHMAGVAADDVVLEVQSFIAIKPVPAGRLAGLAERRLVAVFTSVNAVEAVLAEVGRPRRWKIYCLGGATYQRLAGELGKACIAGQADSATALAECIRDRERERQVFFFCGDQRRDELPEILTAEGFEVTETVVYQTVLTPHRLEKSYAGIAFFSPSAVESYFSVNAATNGTVMFAIGHSTADAIRSRCDNQVMICPQPDKPTLIRTMIDYFINK